MDWSQQAFGAAHDMPQHMQVSCRMAICCTSVSSSVVYPAQAETVLNSVIEAEMVQIQSLQRLCQAVSVVHTLLCDDASRVAHDDVGACTWCLPLYFNQITC